MVYRNLLQKIQKRASKKLIDWFKQWCILKKIEYEKIRRISSHKEECNKQDYATKSIRPDPRIVALYNLLKSHPEFGKILTEVMVLTA